MSTNQPAEAPPTTGLVAGKYQLLRLIGRGGMGSVWEARHSSLGTRVAIKFVEVEQAQSEEARTRFQNEARAAASIQSKHAIKVHDHGMLDDGRPYIVMELLVGEALDRRLDLLHRLPLDDVARLVQQVARALQQAHEAGITHRDLKPENIFLERSEGDDQDTAKVLDFGIAKMRDPVHAAAIPSTTKTGVLMGTPFFMSPEQARGLKTVDHRSDLWSLAVIVFRCVTGKLPFDGESLGDLLVKICASPVPAPSSILPGLPPQFDAWMARALDREPAQRFQTALELAESLAMVAGISVRFSSRRSQDPLLTPSPGIGATELAPATAVRGQSLRVMTPTALTPGVTPRTSAPRVSVPGDSELAGQPIPPGTSAPFTASNPVIPMNSGMGAVPLAIVAGLLFVGAAGGTFWWTHRTTATVAPATGVAPPAAAAATPSETSAPSTTAAPTSSEPTTAVDRNAEATRVPPSGSATPAVPASSSKRPGATGHGATPTTPPRVATTKPPATTPVAPPRTVTRPQPAIPSGSDPGY